ncbi:caspase family protein [Acaryochloris thomasi]|nr:caspase family protein [Acaryochloris thomasi]
MSLTRRAFLQQTGLTLAGLGFGDVLRTGAQKYQQALADPTPRKLALLVGINQYASDAKLPNLKGCLTDLDLHRELLVHRFGFKPGDIVELRNKDATVSNLEAALVEHLIKQARPHDVVVFHFSGYGRQIDVSPSLIDRVDVLPDTPLNALVPFDALNVSDDQPELNAFLLRDLSRLLRSLTTDQLVSVLDMGLTHPNTDELGHLRVRSLPTASLTVNAVRDISIQDEVWAQLSPSEQLKQRIQRSQRLPGLALAAADSGQTAVEVQWHNYAAGLFTAALTHELWQAMPATTLTFAMNRTVTDVAQPMGEIQVPQFITPRSQQSLIYGAPQEPTADGVVIANDNAVWLGGISPHVLEQYEPQTCFQVLPSSEPVAPAVGAETAPLPSKQRQVQLVSRSGFTGTTEVEGEKDAAPLQTGQLLQEAIRVLPTTLDLNVALGKALDRVERVDATSAFSDLDHMSPVTTSDQPADYLFTKTAMLSTTAANEPETTERTAPSYGLCLLGGTPLSGSSGDPGEAVKTAVRRLRPMLETMLAAKLMEMTVNAAASKVGAIATLETIEADKPKTLVSQYTPRAPWTTSGLANTAPQESIVSLEAGSQIRYQISNYSDRPLYWLLLSVNGTQPIACYSQADQSEVIADRIAPGTSLTVPPEGNKWKLHGPAGFCTTYVIVSRQPLTKTLTHLQDQVGQDAAGEVVTFSELLEVTRQLLKDLNDMSTEAAKAAEIAADAGWALDLDQWATFKFFHQVV